MDDFEDDNILMEVLGRFERQRAFQCNLIAQSGGSVDPNQPGRLEFILQPYRDETNSKFKVTERIYNARMRQTGNFIDRPQLVPALQDGLVRAINQVLDQDMAEGDRLYFTVASNRLTHNFSGWGLTAADWRRGGHRMDQLFNCLSDALNSNESFEMNDTFQVSITRVWAMERGSGTRRRLKPGHKKKETFKLIKRTVVRIKNKDQKCAARAIVVAKAKLENHPRESTIRQGGRLQTVLAESLHQDAGVPDGPCGYQELKKFQAVLPGYRVIVIYGGRQYQCVAFSPASPNKKDLVLLHDDDHYDAVTSLPGFFGTSYFCAHCLKPYDNEGHHRCPFKRNVVCVVVNRDVKDI